MKTFAQLQYLAEVFLELEIFQAKFVEKTKTHILCSTKFSRSRTIYEMMWNILHIWPGHRWQGGRAHACCMLDN